MDLLINLEVVQMVEQFEDRVEERLDVMEAKLKADAEASEAVDNEKIGTVTKQVPPITSLAALNCLSQGV